MKKVLIVVDMQNDFVTGVLGSEYAQAIVPNVVEKIKTYIKNGDTVILTQDSHGGNYMGTREGIHLPVEHCKVMDSGWKIIDDIACLRNNLELRKYDQFGLSQYELETLNNKIGDTDGKGQFEIVGIATNLCVLSVAVTLQNYFNNDEITVDASCCASYDPVLHEKALDVMEGLHFNVINR